MGCIRSKLSKSSHCYNCGSRKYPSLSHITKNLPTHFEEHQHQLASQNIFTQAQTKMSFGDDDNSIKRIKLESENGETIKEDIFTTDHKVSRQRRAKTLDGAGKFRGCVVWFTGYSGAGKSTVAMGVEEQLVSRGKFLLGLFLSHKMC